MLGRAFRARVRVLFVRPRRSARRACRVLGRAFRARFSGVVGVCAWGGVRVRGASAGWGVTRLGLVLSCHAAAFVV